MSPTERRKRLIEVLCLRRRDTYDNLAREFRVSKMTIRRDVAILMCSYPIETVSGRYGGGVKIKDDYFPYRKIFNQEQVAWLVNLRSKFDG